MEINLQFNGIKDYSLPNNYQDMYSKKIIEDGIKFLDIRDANEIFNILKSCEENRTYLLQVADEKQKRENFLNRFVIPKGLTKKEYKELLNQTQIKINNINQQLKELDVEDWLFLEIERDDYISKKEKLNKIISFHNEYGELNITKAKEYPMDQLLEFKNEVTLCIFHEEKTPSLRYRKRDNKVHCFGCGKDADTIDVYQKLYKVDFNTAVKKLNGR